MAHAEQTIDTTLFDRDVQYEISRPWMSYWMLGIRLITGYWFLHAGLTKLLEGGFDASWWLKGASGTLIGPITSLFASGIGLEFVNFMIPVGEFLIGLGLMVGLLTRLASFFGAFIMLFFWVGNAGFGHGLVNSDLMGMLLFITVIVYGAGRVYGLDQIVEKTGFVQKYSRLKYLLG